MSDAEAKLKAEAIALASALHDVIAETCDAESARTALSGLMATQTGRDYMLANPILR